MNQPTIYIASDGKPGHLAQSRGLADAIARQREVQIIECAIDKEPQHLAFDTASSGLILAAGRKACQHALILKRALGLPAIALMNPGWWARRRFDLCVIPKHDGFAESERIIVTEGALSNITPATDASPTQGLILIGGPSQHHAWDDQAITQKINVIIQSEADINWTATGSRRTPQATDQQMRALASANSGRLIYTPASETPPGWVAEQLARCEVCWVSEDSVSMVYECLTAGARVGLFEVPHRSTKLGRVARGISTLVDRGWVVGFNDWQAGQPLPADRPALSEADRVASMVLQRWLSRMI